MINKRKKIPITILLLAILLFQPTNKCYAMVGYNGTVFSNNNNSGSNDGKNPSGSIDMGDGYTCNYTYYVNSSYSTRIYGYNTQNHEIINTSITPDEKIIAGTAIGVKIEEESSIAWGILETSVIKQIEGTPRKCHIIKFSLRPPFISTGGSCVEGSSRYCVCTGGSEKRTEEISDSSKLAECRKMAEKEVSNRISGPGPSYDIKIMDSNDIKNTSVTTLYPSGGCSGSNPIYCHYEYNIKTVCMNVKTSKVKYLQNGNCNSDEIEVKNDNETNHWHYFVPLNAKSNSNFSIIMTNNIDKGLQNKDFCTSLIDNNANYVDFIRDSTHKKLTGKKSIDKSKVEAGCYLGTEITIPIDQKFYNEDNNNKFKGFNFYYKPIDINNPFPNGVGESSIWYEWWRSNNKNPDLTKSYNKATYVAKYINVDKVRNYTKDNPYTSWNNMNLNGTSQFIENESIVNRLVDRDSFYKLGCGPSNSDWSECRR